MKYGRIAKREEEEEDNEETEAGTRRIAKQQLILRPVAISTCFQLVMTKDQQ